MVDIIQGMAALNSLILSILFCFNIEVSTILFSILTYTLHQKKITKNVPDLNTYIHCIEQKYPHLLCSQYPFASILFFQANLSYFCSCALCSKQLRRRVRAVRFVRSSHSPLYLSHYSPDIIPSAIPILERILIE